MKKLFLILIPLTLLTSACGTRRLEQETTVHETCVYDRTHDFWGNLKSEKLVACTTRGTN